MHNSDRKEARRCCPKEGGGKKGGGSQRAAKQLGAGFRGPSHMNGHLTFDVSGPVGLTTGFDVSRQGTNYGYLIDQRSTYACNIGIPRIF